MTLFWFVCPNCTRLMKVSEPEARGAESFICRSINCDEAGHPLSCGALHRVRIVNPIPAGTQRETAGRVVPAVR